MEKLGRRILQNPDYLLKNPRILEKNERATDPRDAINTREGESTSERDICARTEPHPARFTGVCAWIN
jgi:hypothetical protein